MTLLVLFRSRLEWCNFACGYCPWNSTVRSVDNDEFRADAVRVGRIVDRVAELIDRPVEFFITPKAEYLVLPYWREAVRRLLELEHVQRVTVQTNLSFDVEAFLDAVPPGKLALWTTYHPSETDEAGFEALHAKWNLLLARGVPFSVGIVGTRENVGIAESIRARLDPTIYLWINAYKRESDYYTLEELQRIRAVDPWFDLNRQDYLSLGQPCTAGQRAVYLDDDGKLRRCFFVGEVIGDLFRDGWATLPAPKSCPKASCHCYVGQMHVVELDFRSVYGEWLAARIPRQYHLTWPQGRA